MLYSTSTIFAIYILTSSPADAEKRKVLSGIAMQHADDGYSRCGNYGINFGSSLVHSMF